MNEQLQTAARDFWGYVERAADIERRWPLNEHGDQIESGPEYEAILLEYRANTIGDAFERLAAAPIESLGDALAFQKVLAALLACDEEHGELFDHYVNCCGAWESVAAPLGPNVAKACAVLEQAVAGRVPVPDRSAA